MMAKVGSYACTSWTKDRETLLSFFACTASRYGPIPFEK